MVLILGDNTTNDNMVQIVVSCLILIGLLVVLFVAVWYYRRYWMGQERTPDAGAMWTFQDLREMRDRGEISPEEYRALREAMIGAIKGEEQKVSHKPLESHAKDSDKNRKEFP